MLTINRVMILNTLIKHETLTIDDLSKKENLNGVLPNEEHLNYLLAELSESGHIKMLNGVVPSTYTITDKGIIEGTRLSRKS